LSKPIWPARYRPGVRFGFLDTIDYTATRPLWGAFISFSVPSYRGGPGRGRLWLLRVRESLECLF